VDRPKFTLIDRFSLGSIHAGKTHEARLRQFHWRYYAELAEQRGRIAEDLRKAVLRAADDRFCFDHWQRVVRIRWSLKPLSAAGSLKFPGGRFNIGSIDSFESFPALYFAEDKATALSEVFGGTPTGKGGLDGLSLALASRESIGDWSVSGELQTVVRLDRTEALQPFVDCIKGFGLSTDLRKLGREIAREAGLPLPKFLVTSVGELMKTLEAPDWRGLPVQVGIPSNPQIFGQIAIRAGAEAIVYRSKFTGKQCIAVFPTALGVSTSHVRLDDDPPRKDVIARLDRTTWRRLSG